MNKAGILAGIALFVVVLGAFLVFSGTENAEEDVVRFVFSPEEASPVAIFVNEEPIGTTQNRSFTANRDPASFRFEATGFDPVTLEYDGLSDETIQVSFSLAQDSEEAEFLTAVKESSEVALSDGFWVQDARFFENETWLVGTLTTTRRESDGEFVVLNLIDGEWETIYAGTGPSKNSLSSLGVPSSIIQELDSLL